MNKLPIIWEEYSHIYLEKDRDWKISVIMISITITLISFMFNNITFGFLIIVATIVLMINSFTRPKLTRYEINTKGIRINQEFWSFTDLGYFWIEDNREHHTHSRILFSHDGFFNSLLILYLPINTKNDELHDIHEELVKILPEKRVRESFFQTLLEYLGF